MSIWLEEAKSALVPLANLPGCLEVSIAMATDQADLAVVVSRWESVGHYRKALSNFEVKANSIPFLSTAIDEPSAFELVHQNQNGEVLNFESNLAFDAGTIGLGNAADAEVRKRGQ